MASFLRRGEGSESLPGLPKVKRLEDNRTGTGTGSSDSELFVRSAAPLCQPSVLCSGHFDPHSFLLQTSLILICLKSQRPRSVHQTGGYGWRVLACLLLFVLISPFQAPALLSPTYITARRIGNIVPYSPWCL